ncbi:MAG: isochorismatase family protein [Armatimonadetes bacterium]|nr:isochorismatase family protein [Armatimonadota bacterium]
MAIWDDVIPQEEQGIYEQAGWGGRVGFGRRPALIIIDMFAAFVDPAYPFASAGARDCARAIRPILDAARAAGAPVFHTKGQRAAWPVQRGRWKTRGVTFPIMQRPEAYEIVPELAPLLEEPVIVKSFPSAFAGTNLLSYLIYHSVDTVIVTGTVTSGCVRDTVLDAFCHNFRVIVPQEAVCDRGMTSHKVTLFDIHMKYGDVIPAAEVLHYLAQVDQGEAKASAAGVGASR